MSDTASLSADMLAPVSTLEKDAAKAKAGLDAAQKKAEEGYAEKDKNLQDQSREIGRERTQTQNFAQDNPFPHPNIQPWTEKPPENDPMKSFGSWASALGVIAGALTRTGLKSSLNASAAAINAFRKNDMEAYTEAKDVWEKNTKIATENAEWESRAYESAFKLMEKDQALGLAQLQTAAATADNKVMLSALQSGNIQKAFEISKGLADFSAQGPERMLRVQDLSTKIEDQQSRKKLLDEAYANDAKLPPDQQMTPERKAQLRTQIMNPQYTINQAKTLAEGTAGGTELSPEAVNDAAEKYNLTGALPATGSGKAGAQQRKQIINKASELRRAPDAPPRTTGQVLADQAALKGEQKSLEKTIAQQHAINQFEQTAVKNADVLLTMIDKVDSTGVPVLERWIRGGKKAIQGDTDVSNFNFQLGVLIPEVAKILNNPNLTGILSDSARAEAQHLISGDITGPQLRELIPLMKSDFARRAEAITEEIQITKDNISGLERMSKDKPGPAGGAVDHPPVPSGVPDTAQWSPSEKKFYWKDGEEWKSKAP